MSDTLAFATTRAFRPLVDGQQAAPLVAVEHWNGLDKLVDGRGRHLLVKFDRGEPADQVAHDVFGLETPAQARVVDGSPELLAELQISL